MSTTNFLPVQAQPFLLAGSGAVIGDTTITLQSFTQINGTTITMANLGTKAFITLEPGNGTSEEQISFTGVTQNSNGTATLTGVKSVAFIYPYTETSGLSITHAGATTAILSNTAGFYNEFVNKNTDGAVTALITFSSANIPQQDSYLAPTLNAQFAPKKYVDDVAVAGAPNAGTSTKGIVQLATRAQYDAGTVNGSTGAALVVTPDILSSYLVDSGSANIIVITASPVLSSYVAGQKFSVKLANTNTSSTVTLNINGLGAKGVILSGASPFIGTLSSGAVIFVEYDGTNFQVIGGSNDPSGTVTMYAGSSASVPSSWLVCDGTSYLQSTYPALYAVLGSTYGSADGTHFNVPDMRGRIPAGVGTGTGGGASGTGLPTGGTALTAVARGTWKGEETHTLVTTEIPAHTHTVGFSSNSTAGSNGWSIGSGFTQTSTFNSGSTGSDGAHNNIQPIMGLNFIIKV